MSAEYDYAKNRKLGKRLIKDSGRKSRDGLNFKEQIDKKRARREAKNLELAQELEEQNTIAPLVEREPFTISLAIPGSFLNNAQSAELRSYMAGQIARAATLFRVDEVIIYDENNKMTKEDIDAYYAGSWYADVVPSDANFESCFHLAKILEYLECPQYLRKHLFPFQRALKFAGLLNPLDALHHLKADDLSIPYREGVIVDKKVKEGSGPLCDIGLQRECHLSEDVCLPAGTRVTVKILNMKEGVKRLRGALTSSKRVREESGTYWGYNVRLACSLNEILEQDRSKYELIVGTSPRGIPVSTLTTCTLGQTRILVVFGGVNGVDKALEDEDNEATKAKTAEYAFDRLVCSLPVKGSRSERVEENVFVTLSELTMRMNQLCS